MRTSPRSAQLWITQLLHCKYTIPAFYIVNIHQTAPPQASGSNNHLITAYSFIDPERMKGWVDLVSWPTADGLPINGYRLQVQCRPGKVRRSKTDVLPLSYTTNSVQWIWRRNMNNSENCDIAHAFVLKQISAPYDMIRSSGSTSSISRT